MGAMGPKNAWPHASTAGPTTIRLRSLLLFSQDAPGPENNTFKDRLSTSDEPQTIGEQSTVGPEGGSDFTEQDTD
nr:myelin basic protein-like [Paramormyrops kingsleyae]